MKKGLLGLATGLLCLTGLAGCKNGIEKEYTMQIKSEVIIATIEKEEKEISVLHCTRGMSLYNYYIEIPEIEESFEIPKTLIAKATDEKVKAKIINKEGKKETVTDHGYKFLKWGE